MTEAEKSWNTFLQILAAFREAGIDAEPFLTRPIPPSERRAKLPPHEMGYLGAQKWINELLKEVAR